MNIPHNTFLYTRQAWEDNSRWLFDAFREALASQDTATIKHVIKDLVEHEHIKPEEVKFTHTADGDIWGSYPPEPLRKLIRALADESVEIIKVLGAEHVADFAPDWARSRLKEMERVKVNGAPIQNWWGEHKAHQNIAISHTKTEMTRMMTVLVGKAIREFAITEHEFRQGKIPEEQYIERLSTLHKALDSQGLNGIERFLNARPELLEKLKNDEQEISPRNMPGSSSENFINSTIKRNEYFKQAMVDLEESTRLFPQSIDYQRRYTNILHQMMGSEYCAAVEARNKEMPSRFGGVNTADINRSNAELETDARSASPTSKNSEKHYIINNNLGKHLYEKRHTHASNSEKITGAPNSGTAEVSISEQKQNSGSAESAKNQGGYSGSNDGTGSGKNFVLGGKIATTAVAGAFLYHGARNMLSSPAPNEEATENPNKQASSKKFLHAVEIAAATAGIALAWLKGDVLFEKAAKVFGIGGKSA